LIVHDTLSKAETFGLDERYHALKGESR
jgi:hypothetical protein